MALDFRTLVKSGKELIGIFIKTPNYQLVEIVSSCDLSFIVLDAEHAPFDRSELDTSIMAAKSSNIPVMVRAPKSSDEYILNALDQGADGVLVPHINSIDDAKDVISFAKYRDANFPLGKRGFSNSSRSGNYGSLSLTKMIDKANNKTALICQIEEKQAVENIDDIVSQGSVSKNNQQGSCGNGITYAIIDSTGSIDNGIGHTSIPIETNIPSGHLGAFRTTEDFAATFHANGVDIWITFHPLWQKNIVSYLLTCNGFFDLTNLQFVLPVPHFCHFSVNSIVYCGICAHCSCWSNF